MIKNYLIALSALFITNISLGQAPAFGVSIDGATPLCGSSNCATLTAHLDNALETTSYSVAPITYQNLYSYTGGTVLQPMADDVWAPSVVLPFSFCFYGNTYNSLLVGSNGVITFSGPPDPANPNYCPWPFSAAIPNVDFPIKNAIYGVYQDTEIRSVPFDGTVADPTIQNVNYYLGGIAPNRYFVANFNQLPAYACPNSLQTTQIVLYESTNIIDIHIKNRTACPNWNAGNGVVGIQNATGTEAVTPTNRNTGSWSASNESYRFKPNGAETIATYMWTDNEGFAETTNSIIVCPTTTHTYNLSATYTKCDGTQGEVADSVTIEVFEPLPLQNPVDLLTCSDTDMAFFDIDQTATILNGASPFDYESAYYTSYNSALYWENNNITELNSFAGNNGQVIYVRITDIVSGNDCFEIKTFTLNVQPLPAPPSGDSEQTFNEGGTLADLELDGDNIQWYEEAEGGNPLPLDTPLVDEETYFATQTSSNGCESSFRVLQDRFPVTVYFVPLGTPDWTIKNLKVAPNPAKDIVTISSEAIITSIEIYTLLGQKILTQSINATISQIDLSQLASGNYMMKVMADEQMKTIKIIKQ